MNLFHSIDNNHRLPRIFEVLEVGDFTVIAGLNHTNMDSLSVTVNEACLDLYVY